MRERSIFEVFVVFLKLGLTSFGGPIAHLGYFRSEFVVKRRWLDDETYSDVVALCQFLPGPASSQVAFSLGLLHAGYVGGIASWFGFTLPSAILLTTFAYGTPLLKGSIGTGLLHGLTLVAVAIVAQAVFGMARSLCPDRTRASIACVAALVLFLTASAFAQIFVIILGGMLGLRFCRCAIVIPAPVVATWPQSRFLGATALGAFLLLLLVAPSFNGHIPGIDVFNDFYRAGALVVGGGHIVLPFLSDAFVKPGYVTPQAFLSGYGAAQAIPGPLFTFAAYLGTASNRTPHGLPGAVLGVVAIFLPGILLLVGTLPFWVTLRQRIPVQSAMRGVNATVVGILGAALYDPVFITAVHGARDVSIVLVTYSLLTVWQLPALVAVTVGAIIGAVISVLPI